MAAAALVVVVVLPRAESPQAYSEAARLAEAEALPEVLLPASPPTFLAGEGPIHLPPVRLAGREPRTLLGDPNAQTDSNGVVELELPPPIGGPRRRLRVSVLVVVSGRVTGATFILDDPPAGGQTQTVALLTEPLLWRSAWPH